ncbi:MAG: hypothetical protein AAFX07_06610, partial [Pseudomonadota bacterium]
HPELAAAFAKIKPEETPQERIHRFRVLTGQHKSHPESRMLEAELRIAAEDFPGARNSLGDLADTDPTARSLAIMAAIERGSGADDAVVKGWLARALTASRGPQWVCDSCQKVRASWEPVCSSCGAFDTLSWRVSDDEAMSLAGGAEMLPLIVGQIEGPTEEEIEDAEASEEAETEETADTVDAEGSGGEVVDVTDNSASVANADAPPAEYIEGEAPLAKDAK